MSCHRLWTKTCDKTQIIEVLFGRSQTVIILMCASLLVVSDKTTAALTSYCHGEARIRRDGVGGRACGMDQNGVKVVALTSVSSFGHGSFNRNASL